MKSYDYKYRNSESLLVMSEWSYMSYEACSSVVLPDGCRDIIVEESSGIAPSLFLSELSQSAYDVSTPGGVRMCGMRLRPGIQVRQADLYSWLDDRDPATLFSIDQLSEFMYELDNLSEALDCLKGEHQTVSTVANELGVSQRTLERLVKAGTGRPPYFWLSLARIRKAARMLDVTESLGATALDAGFTDQSHMNREMKRWFGRTPAQMLNDVDARHTLAEPGYG